jgi:transmembrane sensor
MEQQEIEFLAIRKLTNSLSKSEEKKLQDILATHPELKLQYEHFEKIFNESGKLSVKKGLSGTERWKNIQEKIQAETNTKPSARPVYSKHLWYYAAAAVLIIMTSLYIYWPHKPSDVEFVAKESTRVIELPDHSVVTLNIGSHLSYNADEYMEDRKLKVDGEAFFDVKKNGAPFTVNSSNATVRVLGTTFNVRSINKITTVTCMTGRVSVTGNTSNQNAIVITKGSGVIVNDAQMPEAFTVTDLNETSWVTGELLFENTPLLIVFSDLERHFKHKITVNRKIGSLTFTGRFDNADFKTALSTVCLTAGLTYSINSDSTTVVK